MNRSVIATTSLIGVVVLAGVVTFTRDVNALQERPFPPLRPVIDCREVDNLACRECCTDGDLSCPGRDQDLLLYCCQNDCDIIPGPELVSGNSFPNILLDLSAGGAQLMFERTQRVEGNSGRNHFEITLQQILFPVRPRSGYTLKAQLTGEGAAVASLLYAVAFLGLGEDALAALQANGYPEVSLTGRPPTETCQARFPGPQFPETICAVLANQLAQGISASLAIGTSGEHEPFLQGLQALGLGLCQVVPE
jgi:hypothetical protein